MQENIFEWFVIFIGESTFEVIKNFVEDIILVSDEEIKRYSLFAFGIFGSNPAIDCCVCALLIEIALSKSRS